MVDYRINPVSRWIEPNDRPERGEQFAVGRIRQLKFDSESTTQPKEDGQQAATDDVVRRVGVVPPLLVKWNELIPGNPDVPRNQINQARVRKHQLAPSTQDPGDVWPGHRTERKIEALAAHEFGARGHVF